MLLLLMYRSLWLYTNLVLICSNVLMVLVGLHLGVAVTYFA